jgi:chromosome segregation ATPase
MIKKLVIFGVIGVVGWYAIRDSKLGTRIRTEVTSWKKAVEDSSSPEKDLARIKADLKLMDVEIQKLIKPLAAETVNVRSIKDQVSEQRAKLSQSKEVLQARAAAIKSATEQVTFGERTMSITAAKTELEEGVKRYTANQKSLESMELTLASRERIKDTLEKQLEALKTQKLELAATVDALEAEVRLLQLQQTESNYQTDNTRLARVKESIRDLKTKVAVQREELKLMPAAFDAPATSTSSSSNKSVDDIMAPLSGKPVVAGKPGSMPPATD